MLYFHKNTSVPDISIPLLRNKKWNALYEASPPLIYRFLFLSPRLANSLEIEVLYQLCPSVDFTNIFSNVTNQVKKQQNNIRSNE